MQNFEDKFSETLTADNNNADRDGLCRLGDFRREEFYPKFLGSVPAAQRALESMLRNAKNAVIASHNLSDFVNADPQQLKFDAD